MGRFACALREVGSSRCPHTGNGRPGSSTGPTASCSSARRVASYRSGHPGRTKTVRRRLAAELSASRRLTAIEHTFVPRPFRPVVEIERAVERGELAMAIAIAKDLTTELGHPIQLATALRLLPLVATQRPDEYSDWALRWLGRWIGEMPGTTIDQTADVASWLAELPADPGAWQSIMDSARWT